MFIAGSQQQTQRMEAMEALRTFSIRVLVGETCVETDFVVLNRNGDRSAQTSLPVVSM